MGGFSVAATGTKGLSTSASIVVPAGVLGGDVMVIWLANQMASGETLTDPSGWTKLDQSTNVGLTARGTVYWKYAAGTLGSASSDVGTTITATLSVSHYWAMDLAAYTGIDQTSAINAHAIKNDTGTASTAHTAPTATTTVATYNIEGVSDKGSSPSTNFTAPTGYTKRSEAYQTGSGAVANAMGDTGATPVAAGSVGGDTWTGTISAVTGSPFTFFIGLKPAASGLTLAGPACNVNVAAPAGSIGASLTLTGPTAALNVTAPAGSFSGTALTMTGPTANVQVTAPAGSIAASTAGVWHHTVSEPGATTIEFVTKSTGTSLKYYVSVNADWSSPVYTSTGQAPDTDGYVRATATGLTAGTQYYWRLTDTVAAVEGRIADGKSKTLGTGAGGFKVAFGGCLTNNNTEGRALTDAATWGPDFWLHLGDYHYHNPTATVTATHLANFEDQIVNSSGGALLALSKNVGMFYNPSDHDFGPSDNENSDLTDFPGAANALLASAKFFPTGTLADTRSPKVGHYRTWVNKRVRFIQVDIRNTDRSPGEMDQTSTSKTMLGATQLAWLQTQLMQPEPFKVIVCDTAWMGTIANQFPTVTDGKDKWPSYPNERSVIYNSPRVGHLEIWHSDSHLVGYATPSKNTWGGIPVLCAAPFGNTGGGLFTSTFSAFYNNTGGATSLYGRVTFADDGTTITRQFDGYDAVNSTVQVTNTVTVLTLTGPTANLNVAAPAGTMAGSLTLTGPTANANVGAPVGAVSTARTGPTAAVNDAAPAGALTTVLTMTGPTAAENAAAPAGSFTTALTLAGPTAALNAAAPSGTITTARTGPTAGTNTAAPAGAVSIALAAPTTAVNTAAPAGSFSLTTTLTGPTSSLNVAAPAGVVGTGVSLTGPTTGETVTAPAGSITTTNTLGGVTAGATVTAPSGTFTAVLTLAGVTSALTVTAPAGAFTVGSGLTGPAAQTTITAPTGAITQAITLTGPTTGNIVTAPAGVIGGVNTVTVTSTTGTNVTVTSGSSTLVVASSTGGTLVTAH